MTDPTPESPSAPQISPARRAVFYTGMALAALGFLSFFSVFITFALHFGDFDNFEANARSETLRAAFGMVGMVVGMGLVIVGARGFAGSGWRLNPDAAHRDLAPWARLRGKLTDEAFAAMPHVRETLAGALHPAPDAPTVKVRCRNCQALNDESARYCGQCGRPL